MDQTRVLDRAGIVGRLAANAAVFRGLMERVGDDQARWRPDPDQWSLLEVVCHLADEERDDFRRRLDLTLHQPGASWPSIDPRAWAVERRYNEREVAPSLEDFLSERETSIRWLSGLMESGGAPESGGSAESVGPTEVPTDVGSLSDTGSPLSSGRRAAPDWSSTYDHPKLGPISAGDLLTSWLAHDFIHIRQMNRLHRQYLVAVMSAHSPDYAGRW